MSRCYWPALLLMFSLRSTSIAAELPRVPEGFTIEKVAGAEHVRHPMMACFDDRGRLYVCESAGTNRKAAELIADPQDSILVLEDGDGDGVYDKSWTFADRLVFPQGCLWYRGAVYTCSSPYLWKLEDTDGDGVCDKRTVLVKSFGFSGNAADIHGPFLGPDERLYWCDGRHGHEIRDLGDGALGGADDVTSVQPHPEPGLPHPGGGELLTKGKAARIFSCRPDGTDLRVLCGGGMDNPVEVDFWETGECLGTVNLFYGKPRGDCLVHWVEGGVYPRDDMPDCIAEFKWTGGLLGPVTNYGHVAVSGLCRYRSREFGDLTTTAADPPGGDATEAASPPDRAAFFVTQFNTHKVVKTVVERHGATFRAVETTDFLVSDDPDFHPTDVLEDADGSLLVIDTGGWFRIGCPQSQIAKPEITGAIYRIRRIGAHQTPSRSTPLPATAGPAPPPELPAPPAKTPLPLATHLVSDSAAVRRSAANALYRRAVTLAALDPNAARLTPEELDHLMLILARPTADDVERHSVIAALIAADDPAGTRPYLDAAFPPAVRRGALIALDQMEHGALRQDEVLPLLAVNHPPLVEAALEVISRREGWGAAVVGLFQSWLGADLNDDRAEILRRFVAAQAREPAIQQFLAAALVAPGQSPRRRAVLLEAVAAAEVATWPEVWTDPLRTILAGPDADAQLDALRIIAARRLDSFDDTLLTLLDDPSRPDVVRIEALAALAPRRPQLSESSRRFFDAQLREAPALLRLKVASAYAALPQEEPQLFALADALPQIGPAATVALLPAFEGSDSQAARRRLVQALLKLDDLPPIPPADLRRLLDALSPDAAGEAAALWARYEARAAESLRLVEKYLPWADGGDPHRGRYVFFGQTAACSKCHRVGSEGAQIGPDLTKIGAIRQPRDLVEAILLPSASFARDYHSYTAVTSDGRQVNGLISRQTADAIVFRLTDLSEVRLRRDEIEWLRESETSIMPQGLEQKLSEQEFRDLLAYLRSLQ